MYTLYVAKLFIQNCLNERMSIVLHSLQRSEYVDACLNEECMIKIVKTVDDSTGSNEALSVAGHVPSSSVSIIIFLRTF